jgi:hypothetical protein
MMAAESDNQYDRPMAYDKPKTGMYEKPKIELLGSLHDITLADTYNPYEGDGGTSYTTVNGYKFPANGSF